uniref:Transcription repressor n=2 Tax=Cajanus cajan TaxID=3821 RepID=A0A151TUF2_CAJCA|nr:hypothetical protein KK1_009911 [Cajanus cajan]
MQPFTPESPTSVDHNHNPASSPATSSTNLESKSEPEPADFATACASQRFFFSSPGRSNSIVESTGAAVEERARAAFSGSVAVATYSPDPYADFRRSMEEMVEARPELMDVKSNWDVLQELLLCYLALNPKTTHKFILTAFSDLLVSLVGFSSSASSPPPNPAPDDVASGGCSN